MLSKNKIKYINSLKITKFRHENKQFVAEGSKLVKDLIQEHFDITELYATAKWSEENSELTENLQIYLVTDAELKRISNLTEPNGVLALANIPSMPPGHEMLPDDLLIVLDGISDPGNMGTIIRTADWFGIKDIICSEDTVDVFNPKVVQATMGSIARVKVHYDDLESFMKSVPPDIEICGTFMDGENLYETVFSPKTILVFGSEAKGISKELLPLITKKLTVPASGNRTHRPESLNVAVSHAIITAEYMRRQNQ